MASKGIIAAGLLIGAAIAGFIFAFRSARPATNNVTFDSTSRANTNVENVIRNSTSARAVNAEMPLIPKFVGYLTLGSERWFALSLPTADASLERQEWFMLGQKIAGFEITSFDNDKQAILLRDTSGKEVEVRLVDGKVTDSDEEFRRRVRQLIDTSPRAIRDLYPPNIPAPRR